MASYRDVEELLAERGIDVDHVTVYPPRGSRWRGALGALVPALRALPATLAETITRDLPVVVGSRADDGR
jgi:hypothetical protein